MKKFIKLIKLYAPIWSLEEITGVLTAISKEKGFKGFKSIRFTHDEMPEIEVIYDYEKLRSS